MKASQHYRQLTIVAVTAVCFMILLLGVRLPSTFGESTKPSLSPQEQLRLGERMYREGLLPSGKPMQAVIKGDVHVPATSFTCVSCHLRSGLGSVEGGVYTPPTNGESLYKPPKVHTLPEPDIKVPKTFYPSVDDNRQHAPRSQLYSDTSLAAALRDGIDPSGRILSEVMPRYLLDGEEMTILISYLKSLSAELSPGASVTELHFATIVTEDVSPEARNAMTIPLENYVRSKNLLTDYGDNSPGGIRARLMYVSMAPAMRFSYSPMATPVLPSKEYAAVKLSLSRWVLKGPPATWRAQLEEYYRKEPVFAILGGITSGEWQPIQQFCEDNRIPDLFPITDYPTISQSDWYTLYFSKGYYQEGEGAARFLNGQDELKGKPILQIFRDTPEGRALSRGFQETWHEFGQTAPLTLMLKAGETLTAESLQQQTAQENPAAIILWDGPQSLKTLELLAAGKNKPTLVLVSSSYLGESMFSLNEQLRGFTYLTYPYGLPRAPGEKSASLMAAVKNFNVQANTLPTVRISQQSYNITLILDMALMQMRGNYYRDNLLDQIGMLMDLDLPLYERLSFGSGQRYASKGCYIVQLGKGAKPELIKKSAWVMH